MYVNVHNFCHLLGFCFCANETSFRVFLRPTVMPAVESSVTWTSAIRCNDEPWSLGVDTAGTGDWDPSDPGPPWPCQELVVWWGSYGNLWQLLQPMHSGTWKDHDIVVRTTQSPKCLAHGCFGNGTTRDWRIEPPETTAVMACVWVAQIGDFQWCSEEKSVFRVQQPPSTCLRRRRKTPEPSKYFTRGRLSYWVQSQSWFQDVSGNLMELGLKDHDFEDTDPS